MMGVKDAFTERLREEQAKWPKPIDLVREALETEGVTDHYLALLAERYVTLVNTGQEKPVDYLAKKLGRSLATVKGHLWQARQRKILEGGSAGRKGGSISEEGRQLVMDWYRKHRSLNAET